MTGLSSITSRKREIFISDGLFLFLLLSIVGISFSIAVSSIAFGIACAFFILKLFQTQERGSYRTPIDYFVIAYCIAELLATVFSIDRLTSLIFMKRLFLILIMYMVIVGVDDEKRFRWIFSIVIGINAFFSIIESVVVLHVGENGIRLGIFQHYMTAGGMKMFILLLVFPLIVEKKIPFRWKIFAIVCFIPTFLALILTETRSSWLGFVAGIVTIGLLKNKKIIFVLVLAIIIFLAIAPANIKSRAFSIVDLHHPSNVERIHKISAGWRMFLSYPLVGTGDIDLGQIYNQYKDSDDPDNGGHLHNNLIMLLVTLGIVGFMAVMALFVKIFQVELQSIQHTSDHWLYGNVAVGCLAAFVGFHINGLFEWNFGDHEIAVLLWFTVGLALVSQKLFQKLPRKESS